MPRRPLFDRLSAAGPGHVILVCGPAGSGKTVLVRSWVESEGPAGRVAWVSAERDERDPQRFWLSVIDELAGAIGEDELLERLAAMPASEGRAVVERLLSDLQSLERPVALVIDDLHELRSDDALRWLERFVALVPVRELERHPRHHTAHGTLLSTILDMLRESSPWPEGAAPLRDELSEAEMRVVRYLPNNSRRARSRRSCTSPPTP